MRKLNLGTARRGRKSVMAMLFLLAPLQLAHAAQPVANTEGVFGGVPMPCAEEASRLMNRQLVRMAPDQILDGMGRASDARADWTNGHPQYEKARAILVNALAAEEKAGGPLFRFSAEKILNDVVSNWSADQKSYYASYFSRPSGKLYLTDMLEGATCKGWLKSLNSPPFPPLVGADKAHWDKLIGTFRTGEDQFVAKLRALSKEERQSFEMGFKKLDRVFDSALMKVATQQDAELKARIEKSMRPRLAELVRTLQGGE